MGTIVGRVSDSATGEPIAGAQVTVVGTTQSNLTGSDGRFFVNEVTPGLQSIQATMLGYRSLVIQDQRILAGQSVILNFELEQTAVELTPLSVEGERNPRVPRDLTSSQAIVKGELVDQLPIDNTNQVVELQPGVYSVACEGEFGPDSTCVSIRGGRPNEEAVYVDGVLVRSFGTGQSSNVLLPTNSLQQLNVNVGAVAAEYGETQSGVISFVTRSGGPRFTGSLEYTTDQLAPDEWRTNINRLEASVGGPIYGPLTFFLAGTATGQADAYSGEIPPVFVVNGGETCPEISFYVNLCDAGAPAEFSIPSVSTVDGAADSIRLTAPNFVAWDNGRTYPFGERDRFLFTGNLNYQLPNASRINFAYTRNRSQTNGRADLYNPDERDAFLDTRDIFSLGAFISLTQSATQQLALDLRASYQTDAFRRGTIDRDWLASKTTVGGFTVQNLKFAIPEDGFIRRGLDMLHPTEEYIRAYRSNQIPDQVPAAWPDQDLNTTQSLPGLPENLRYNPYGLLAGFPINGFGNLGLDVRDERRLQFRGSLDWQLGRFNRFKAGGEFMEVDLARASVGTMFKTAAPEMASPTRAGLFIQDRVDLGDLVLEAGLRWDYLDAGVEVPLVPGFVYNVPDSLKAGFVQYDSLAAGFRPVDEPCNGASVCRDNFVQYQSKWELSPRLGASFPVTTTSTFRLSYGQFAQTPSFFTSGNVFASGASAGGAGIMESINLDRLDGGGAYARDVDLPKTRTFEFGFRQMFGSSFLIDLAVFNKRFTGHLTFRNLLYQDPNNGQDVYIAVLTNGDFGESTGFEIRADLFSGNLFQTSVSYSYIDASGTGSDPFTYLDLISTRTSAFGTVTGRPENPPEVLAAIETTRRHNLSGTLSLLTPHEWWDGSVWGSIFRDFGAFAVFTIRSGQLYTKLENRAEGQLGPPSKSGISTSSLSALSSPWVYTFDLRFSKAFGIGNAANLQIFLDWRNPLDLSTTRNLFLETASPINSQHRERLTEASLRDGRFDGDNQIDDFDILAESEDNDFNKYMLLRAENRYGDGDGVFTVDEQRTAFAELYDATWGFPRLVVSDQSLRLGVRVSF